MAVAHQRGVPELIELILPRLPVDSPSEIEADDPERVRVAFIGRPNVGKSTLVNRLLGEERMIASEVAGTTRDSISPAGARSIPSPTTRKRSTSRSTANG